jgi:hypothetical protein
VDQFAVGGGPSRLHQVLVGDGKVGGGRIGAAGGRAGVGGGIIGDDTPGVGTSIGEPRVAMTGDQAAQRRLAGIATS